MKATSRIQTGKTYSIDFDALPQVSKQAIVEYGTQRWINDKVNGFKNANKIEDKDELEKFAEGLIDRLLEGQIQIARSAATKDPRTDVVADILKGYGINKKDTLERIRKVGLEAVIAKLEEKELTTAKKIENEVKRRAEAAEKAEDSMDFDGIDAILDL